MDTQVDNKQKTETKKGLHPVITVLLILFILVLIIGGIREGNVFGGFMYMGWLFQALFGFIGSLFTGQNIRY
jgi:hypothetical protein